MRAAVDSERCAGHGACVATCPEVFALTDDGFSEVLVDEIPGAHVAAAKQAANECPEHAITITD